MRKASPTGSDVIVVGGGVAAGACVTTLRESGFDGTITVACAEPHPPYTRPGLTKQVLRGEKPPAAALWRPGEWYLDQSVVLLTGARAGAIDARARTVQIAGRWLGYRSLVLATGAEPRRLSLGSDAAGRVHPLRSFADADAIRPHLGEGTRWLVIGGGFIGAEFAASAALTGSDISLVMAEDVMLERPFGPEVGAWFDARLRRRGVRVCAGTTVESVARHADDLQIRLTDGSELVVDRIVVGAGVIPNTQLAAEAGLELALGGIAVDESLRTSESGIYAIGDVAAYDSPLHGRRVRIEHWDVARSQGAHVAGELMSSRHEPFRVLPYFFGTMGDWAFLEYVGLGEGRTIFRGSPDEDEMSAAYVGDDDALRGLITVGRPDDLAAARELVPEGARVVPEAIADARVPLRECVRGVAAVTG